MTVGKIDITGATHTRKSFLNPFFQPLVDRNDLTLGKLQEGLAEAVAKLNKYGIFHPVHSISLSQSTSPMAAQTDVDVAMVLNEKPRLHFKTGTELGNTEGSASVEGHARNIFGGGESLTLHAATGTRTRSAYSGEFQAPIVPANPDTRITFFGLRTSTSKPWSSHEELIKSAGGKLTLGENHQIAYGTNWRTITGLAATASPTVRHDAGDSVKNSVTYTFLKDTRNNQMLPQSGYLWKSIWEVAGWGPLGGDVSFSKSEMEFGGAIPAGKTGISFGFGVRMGMMYPLPMGYSYTEKALPSRINDRFQLGGPNDVRGFKHGGLGPRDGNDATGGDVFAAGSVNLMLPVPGIGAESKFRIQLFANGGRMVALKNKNKSKAAEEGLSPSAVQSGMVSAIQDLCSDLPSTAFGVGLVYGHDVARFELNFSLPWVVRRGEEARKGLQVGVGINFM